MFTIHGCVRSVNGKPLGGIAVSNGEAIVGTDGRGRFDLDVDPALHRFIFATRPNGFGDTGWYLPTPRTKKDVELVLQPPVKRRSAKRSLRIGHITDIHLGSHMWVPPRQFACDLRKIREIDPDLDLIIATGDLTAKGDLPSLRAFRGIVDRSTQRIVPVFGGHDGREEACLPRIRGWEQVMGPTCFSIEVGGWHLVLWSDQDDSFTPELVDIKRRWLEADLAGAAGKRIILAQHGQPGDAFLKFIAGRGVELVLFGHVHASKCYEHAGVLVLGTPPLVFGGHDAMPRGYRRIELGHGRIRNHHRAFIRCRHARTKPHRRFKIAWQIDSETCLNRGQPLVAGSSVFIPLSDEEFRGRSGVLCLAADTGRRNWLSPTEHSIRGGLAMAGRLLVLVTQAGEVLALNRDTGKTVWSRKLKEFPHRWIHSTAVIVAGTVIAGNGEGGIEGLDLRTGEPLWHWTHLEGQLDRPHFVRPTPLGNDVAIPVRGIGVSCLSALTGQPRWHFNARYDPMLPSPLLAGRRLLVPEGRDKIHAVDPEDGRRLWTRRTPGHEVVGWACNSEVLVLNTFHRSRPGTAQCRRVTNGNLLWNVEYRKDLADMLEYSCGGSQALAAPLLTGQMVYLAGLDGRLCMVDRKTGTCSGRLDLGEPIVSTASLNEHALLTVTYPGRITRIDTPHLSPTPR